MKLKSKASQIMKSYPALAENYSEVIQHLKVGFKRKNTDRDLCMKRTTISIHISKRLNIFIQ